MIEDLLHKHPIISDQVERRELKRILECLERVLHADVNGDVVEFGCYVGTTSLFLRRVLDAQANDKTFHVYDSFAGLPEKSAADRSPAGEQFIAGELKTSKQVFIQNFKRANLKLPRIHAGWFNQLSASDVPDEICFAFLDGDYYESIMTSLKLIEHKLQPGAMVVIDDYQSEALPGARRAADAWAKQKGYALVPAHSLGIVQIPG